jgi:hypothetical protein
MPGIIVAGHPGWRSTMATRAEQKRADDQRARAAKKKKPSAKRSKPGIPKAARSRDKKHAAKKATYALETNEGRASRKSTRKSANRAKPDAALNGREQIVKGAPSRRFARDAAQASRG